MSTSKVYFTDMHAKPGRNLQQKLEALMNTAGLEIIDFSGKYAAVKLHFGEPGNLAYLRPNYAKTVCDYVKKLEARSSSPTATPCTWAAGKTLWTTWTAPMKTATTPL